MLDDERSPSTMAVRVAHCTAPAGYVSSSRLSGGSRPMAPFPRSGADTSRSELKIEHDEVRRPRSSVEELNNKKLKKYKNRQETKVEECPGETPGIGARRPLKDCARVPPVRNCNKPAPGKLRVSTAQVRAARRPPRSENASDRGALRKRPDHNSDERIKRTTCFRRVLHPFERREMELGPFNPLKL
ncbi:hypothetical protein EVAR_4129_1 [Eumeta japonica]|uniref:Uncharacterized protein n=1 Tax=Eumeta variegata TaxID=151549 RepID=A0A4C2A072_EUMVA|nr:hypothetical protein EVAR_4129_1 [Eumeta japonica]